MGTTEPSAAPGRPKQASAPSGGSAPHEVGSVGAPLDYLLHLADSALILGQRNAEWCGHGPVLEEDIALANIGLDLIGQARLLYQHAAALMNDGSTEDSLAYLRDAPQFRNYVLVELPHRTALAPGAASDRDYAVTIARNFLVAALMVPVWEQLAASQDTQLAAIAERSAKETRYHLRHSRDWLLRLGDGTQDSHARMQAALDYLLPYTQEFWTPSPHEVAALANRTGCDMAALRPGWDASVAATLTEATLKQPSAAGAVPQGKLGHHSEHLSYLLAEMQSLARAHPGAKW